MSTSLTRRIQANEAKLTPQPDLPKAPEPQPQPDLPKAPEPQPQPDLPKAPEPQPQPDLPKAPEPQPQPDLPKAPELDPLLASIIEGTDLPTDEPQSLLRERAKAEGRRRKELEGEVTRLKAEVEKAKAEAELVRNARRPPTDEEVQKDPEVVRQLSIYQTAQSAARTLAPNAEMRAEIVRQFPDLVTEYRSGGLSEDARIDQFHDTFGSAATGLLSQIEKAADSLGRVISRKQEMTTLRESGTMVLDLSEYATKRSEAASSHMRVVSAYGQSLKDTRHANHYFALASGDPKALSDAADLVAMLDVGEEPWSQEEDNIERGVGVDPQVARQQKEKKGKDEIAKVKAKATALLALEPTIVKALQHYMANVHEEAEVDAALGGAKKPVGEPPKEEPPPEPMGFRAMKNRVAGK